MRPSTTKGRVGDTREMIPLAIDLLGHEVAQRLLLPCLLRRKSAAPIGDEKERCRRMQVGRNVRGVERPRPARNPPRVRRER